MWASSSHTRHIPATADPSQPSSSSRGTTDSDSLSHIPYSLLSIAAAVLAGLAGYRLYQYYHNKSSSSSSCSSSSSPSSSSSSSSSSPLRVGTRTSSLAMWQARHVCDALRALSPSVASQIIGINTTGDIQESIPLTAFSNKGVFTKELDVSLLNQQVDVAVHCMKDLPTILPEGLVMASVIRRGTVEDAVIIADKHRIHNITHLSHLPAGSVIGTGALRRQAQLHKHYPALECRDIRGNVNTRLMKLDRGDFDALILAAVGLQRLDYTQRIAHLLPVDTYGYAVGQGALALLTRRDDHVTRAKVLPLDHRQTRVECEAERALLRTLQGGCKVPITVRSVWKDEATLVLWAAVLSVDGKQTVSYQAESCLNVQSAETCIRQAVELGCEVGRQLLAHGADAILASIR